MGNRRHFISFTEFRLLHFEITMTEVTGVENHIKIADFLTLVKFRGQLTQMCEWMSYIKFSLGSNVRYTFDRGRSMGVEI